MRDETANPSPQQLTEAVPQCHRRHHRRRRSAASITSIGIAWCMIMMSFLSILAVAASAVIVDFHTATLETMNKLVESSPKAVNTNTDYYYANKEEQNHQVLRGTVRYYNTRRMEEVGEKLKHISHSGNETAGAQEPRVVIDTLSMKTNNDEIKVKETDSKAGKIDESNLENIVRLQSKAEKIISAKKDDTPEHDIIEDADKDYHHGFKQTDNDISVILDPEKREISDDKAMSSVPQKCLRPKALKLPLESSKPPLVPPKKPLPTNAHDDGDTAIAPADDAVTALIESRVIDPNTGEVQEEEDDHDDEDAKEDKELETKPSPPMPPPSSTTTTTKNHPSNKIINVSNTTSVNATELALSSNNTTVNETSAETSEVVIEYENICDMYGNLLPGETSYAPTVTPAIDEIDDQDITDLPALADNDHDGLTNKVEIALGTDPLNSDSDTDGLHDGQEVSLGMDPLLTDSDMDGRTDYEEVLSPDVLDTIGTADNDGDGLSNTIESESGYGSDPDLADTDEDGLADGMEVNMQGTNPIFPDTDGDKLSDYDEVMIHGTNPLAKDSDGDGMSDGFEIEQGLDPISSNSNSSNNMGGISPGCDVWSKNEWGTIYTTSIPASVNFVYELAVSDDSNVTYVSEIMENKLARMVGGALIQCEVSNSTRKLEPSSSDQDGTYDRAALGHMQSRQRRHLLVDGIDRMPQDIITEMACTYFTADNSETPSNSSCYVVQGLMTLYLRENSALTSTLQSSSEALKTILDAMNKDDPSPFLEDSENEFSINGVVGVRYIKGTPDEGGVVLIDNSGNQDSDAEEDVDGAEAAFNTNEARSSESLSSLGISMVVIGAVAIVGTLVAATVLLNKRKRKASADSKYAEFFDDANDLEMKNESLDITADIDASSTRDGSTPMSKRSRRFDSEVAEEDSVFSGLDNYLHDENNLTFVRTPNDNDTGSVAMTTFEQGYEMAIPSIFLENRSPTRRYQASPIEKPIYDNPLGIRKSPEANGREYYVGNTVEF